MSAALLILHEIYLREREKTMIIGPEQHDIISKLHSEKVKLKEENKKLEEENETLRNDRKLKDALIKAQNERIIELIERDINGEPMGGMAVKLFAVEHIQKVEEENGKLKDKNAKLKKLFWEAYYVTDKAKGDVWDKLMDADEL